MRAMTRVGIIGRLLGRQKAAQPRPGGHGPAPPEPRPAPPRQGESNPHADLERVARGFVADHAFLLDRGDSEVLERVFVEGARVFNAIHPEAVSAANRAAAAKRALAAAIRDPQVPALLMQEIKEEEADASLLNASLAAVAGELSGFLGRVHDRLPTSGKARP